MNATITWDANSESDLAGYRVYYGTSSGVYGTSVDVIAPTVSRDFVGLTDGQTYFFVVTAYDTSDNESAYSAEVHKRVDLGRLIGGFMVA